MISKKLNQRAKSHCLYARQMCHVPNAWIKVHTYTHTNRTQKQTQIQKGGVDMPREEIEYGGTETNTNRMTDGGNTYTHTHTHAHTHADTHGGGSGNAMARSASYTIQQSKNRSHKNTKKVNRFQIIFLIFCIFVGACFNIYVALTDLFEKHYGLFAQLSLFTFGFSLHLLLILFQMTKTGLYINF